LLWLNFINLWNCKNRLLLFNYWLGFWFCLLWWNNHWSPGLLNSTYFSLYTFLRSNVVWLSSLWLCYWLLYPFALFLSIWWNSSRLNLRPLIFFFIYRKLRATAIIYCWNCFSFSAWNTDLVTRLFKFRRKIKICGCCRIILLSRIVLVKLTSR